MWIFKKANTWLVYWPTTLVWFDTNRGNKIVHKNRGIFCFVWIIYFHPFSHTKTCPTWIANYISFIAMYLNEWRSWLGHDWVIAYRTRCTKGYQKGETTKKEYEKNRWWSTIVNDWKASTKSIELSQPYLIQNQFKYGNYNLHCT